MWGIRASAQPLGTSTESVGFAARFVQKLEALAHGRDRRRPRHLFAEAPCGVYATMEIECRKLQAKDQRNNHSTKGHTHTRFCDCELPRALPCQGKAPQGGSPDMTD